ncbi:quercetin dioxygenase-like cupin family protein [Allocatelliglobosispora scoriae]|uniref:Quercetin dioxygenase-like cupin family protein n=1 Tax=Allocatelliglobosispora scoriae TaxID=643052 RepID=A0A841C1K0_9ACTN|nr:cupin domain-containing protein [Allocatelliglobosispora scoriae]MBB5872850.1 quercetin dioxygenase-like cupin family protein [Allocatelliglobosispora scoriae]
MTIETSGTTEAIKTLCIDDVPANRKRGGDVRTLLSPGTVGSTAGFLGTVRLLPGEVVTEHLHPYSEEFLFCVEGEITLRLDGQDRPVRAREGVMIPIGVRHRVMQEGTEPAFLVFFLGPLAPEPHLGHVDTEPYPEGSTA